MMGRGGQLIARGSKRVDCLKVGLFGHIKELGKVLSWNVGKCDKAVNLPFGH